MAEIEHIKLLCQGVTAWNDARAKEDFRPDLSHVEIRDAVLAGCDFRGVEFDGARFFNVDAKQARFQKARLNGLRAVTTSFEGSELRAAELKGADFTRSCFRAVDLSDAVSFDLKFRHSDLSGARFAGAGLESAHFYNSNLVDAVFGDAALEASIFKRVRIGEGPAAALVQAGARMALPNQPREDEWIDWTQYRVEDHGDDFGSILYRNQVYWISEGRWDFFISHASPDKEAVARPLADALDKLGQRVWYDEFTIKLGDDLNRVIDYGTRSSLFGILVISPDFFGRRWTEAELDALQHKRLFLVRHGVEAEALGELRPELADRVSIDSDAGPSRIAEAIVAAIRTPREQAD